MSKQFVEEMVRNEEWKATLQLLIATKGGEIYKKHVIDMFPEAQKHLDRGGWMSVLALPYMGRTSSSKSKPQCQAMSQN